MNEEYGSLDDHAGFIELAKLDWVVLDHILPENPREGIPLRKVIPQVAFLLPHSVNLHCYLPFFRIMGLFVLLSFLFCALRLLAHGLCILTVFFLLEHLLVF